MEVLDRMEIKADVGEVLDFVLYGLGILGIALSYPHQHLGIGLCFAVMSIIHYIREM